MTFLIGADSWRKNVFGELGLDMDQAATVTMKFTKIIIRSIISDRQNGRPVGNVERETKRRFEILAKWIRVMRGDMQWTWNRSLDELPRALRAELDGEDYDPPKRLIWTPSN